MAIGLIRPVVEYETAINIQVVNGIQIRRRHFIQGRMSNCDEEEIEKTLNSYLDEENERIDIVNNIVNKLDCNHSEKVLLSKAFNS